MAIQYDLRDKDLTENAVDTSATTRRRRVRLTTLARIVTIVAVVAGAWIVTQDDSRMVSSAPTAQAEVLDGAQVSPEGLATIEPTAPRGYWNPYLNEWVELTAVESAAPRGYWNPYLNEWVELTAVESAASTATGTDD